MSNKIGPEKAQSNTSLKIRIDLLGGRMILRLKLHEAIFWSGKQVSDNILDFICIGGLLSESDGPSFATMPNTYLWGEGGGVEDDNFVIEIKWNHLLIWQENRQYHNRLHL